MHFLLPHIIDHSAAQFPEREAFRFQGQALTYAELQAQANQLAHTLIETGIKPGDRVGIYHSKSLVSAVAIYGIMKAGAAYVPLDPAIPPGRLRFILDDCDIRHLITEARLRRSLHKALDEGGTLDYAIGMSVVAETPYRSLSWDEVARRPVDTPAVSLMEQDIAYIMYTSGSTGEPKGLVHTHASGLSYARMAAAVYDLQPEDRLSNFPPLHFDQSTFDYFSGPLVGATTVIIPEAHTRFPASLSELMAAEKLTIWYSVPYALIQLLLRGVLEDRNLESLRWVLFGGEAFPPKYLRALMAHWPQARFSNVYGPAEVNQCTFYHVPPLTADDDSPLPIGDIWPNAEGLVLDDDDQPVPPGEVGELLVRTPTMMAGYWNRPDLNAQAFYFRGRPGGGQARFYRTGDLVQLRPDGLYNFLGRKDRQVKIRGYRVELDEVEAALMAHPLVEEAAVFPVQAEDTQEIQAAIIPKTGTTLKTSDLLAHLSQQVPRYAVPGHLLVRHDFPRTSSGKIDRRALQSEAMVGQNV